MNLHEYQTVLAEALHPRAKPTSIQAISGVISANHKLQVEEQVDIYRQNISGGYIRSLASTFVICQTIVGAVCFATLVREYAWQRLQHNHNLYTIGVGFPDFLANATVEHTALSDFAYLVDLAQLEYFVEQSFLTACYSQQRPDGLGDMIHANKLRRNFVINPSLFLLKTDDPIFDIWRMHRKHGSCLSIPARDQTDYLCICRNIQEDVMVTRIDANTYNFLHSCKHNSSKPVFTGTITTDANSLLQMSVQNNWVLAAQQNREDCR